MGMTDADKRIDLAAPLLSVRRHGGAGAEVTATLPAYKADATSGPLGHTGAVPFRWEQRPGHPKSVRTRRPPPPPPPTVATTRTPTMAVAAAAARAHAEEEEESFSDARDTLSRDDDASCVTVNCSATGLSDAAAGAGPVPPGARGGIMMDRFLPAAHAVAAGSPPCAFRKAGSARPAAAAAIARAADDGDRPPVLHRRLPLQHVATNQLPPLSPDRKNDDDAESDAHSTRGFASRRCGLLPARCVKSALLLSCGSRRGAAARPFPSTSGGSKRAMDSPLLRSRKGQKQQPQRTGDDSSMQSWEEVYVKSLLRSGRGGLMGPAAAVASELDRTVRELYKRRAGQAAVLPKSSHLGLLLVLDRSNEDHRGHGSSARRKLSRTSDTALLLPPAATSSPPSDEKKLGRGAAGGGYGFPLLLEDKEEAVAGREIVLSPQPQPLLLPPPLPKSPSESWLSRALPSVSTRPPATSFLGLHVQSRKHAPLPWCSIDSASVDNGHGRKRHVRVHGLLK